MALVAILSSGGGGSNGLLTGLANYWGMTEAANGTRADTVGSKNLSDVNTNVGQTSGLAALGNAAVFTNTAAILRNTAYGLGSGSFTISLWVRFTSLDPTSGGFYPYPFGIHKASDTGIYCDLYSNSTKASIGGDGLFHFEMDDASAGAHYSSVAADPGDGIVTGANYLLVCGYDAGPGELFLRVNGGSVSRAAKHASLNIATVRTADGLTFGNYADDSGADGYGVDGREQQGAVWHRALSLSEMNSLYAGGAGLAFAAWD